MKKFVVSILLTLPISNAIASENKSVFWECKQQFSAKASGSSAVFMGNYKMEGNGLMRCRTINLFKPRVPAKHRHVVQVQTLEQLNNLNKYLEEIDKNPVEIRIPTLIKSTGQSQIGMSLTNVYLSGFSQQWALTKDIKELLGSFVIANGYSSFGLGLGGFTAVKLSKPAISLSFAIYASIGFGFSYGVSKFNVTLDENAESIDALFRAFNSEEIDDEGDAAGEANPETDAGSNDSPAATDS